MVEPTPIPRVFHRVWFGGPMPAELEAYGETFRRHHPDWTFRVWSERNLPPLRNQRLFERASSYAQKADIARLEILHRFGGVYVDADVECLRPFDGGLLQSVTCFCAEESPRYYCTAILGSVPGHPLIDAVIRAMPVAVAAAPGAGPVVQTGPVLFTRVLHDRQERGLDDVVVFPSALFYPYHWSEPHKRRGPFPHAYAVHHWAGSWKQQLGKPLA
ncbi:MAG TPA: glycosyltransferase [Polyangiaceae bacterium]|jgi:mannosyltransferase OCH1-like enzyme